MSNQITHSLNSDGLLQINVNNDTQSIKDIVINIITPDQQTLPNISFKFTPALPEVNKKEPVQSRSSSPIKPVITTVYDGEYLLIKDSCFPELMNYVSELHHRRSGAYYDDLSDDPYRIYKDLAEYIFDALSSESTFMKFENLNNDFSIEIVNSLFENKAQNC